MKTIILSAFALLITTNSFSQEELDKTFFAQGMLQIDSKATMDSLQAIIRNEPYIKIARLDWYSKRIFILTRGLDTLPLSQFKSWFGGFSNKLSCIQIGVYGTDTVNKFPFTNCNN